MTTRLATVLSMWSDPWSTEWWYAPYLATATRPGSDSGGAASFTGPGDRKPPERHQPAKVTYGGERRNGRLLVGTEVRSRNGVPAGGCPSRPGERISTEA